MTDINRTPVKTSHDKQAEALGVILTITQSLVLSGCNRAEKDVVVTHLMNGLQTGALDGDNFRSVIYHAPRLTQAIADGLNVKRRELKRMAFAGELTADVVIKAIASQFNVMNSEFKELPMSLGGDKPNKNSFIGTGVLSGLCVAAVVTVFSLTNCRPANAGYEPLQGNVISLQGNDNAPKNNGNEINIKLPLALFKDKGYDVVLSKTNSGRADRRTLAFYVPSVSIDPQINTDHLDTAPRVQLRTPRAKTLIKAIHLPTDYDGMTSLNKIAERRISGAAAICAESEPRHPILLPYGVTPTQKQIGGIHA